MKSEIGLLVNFYHKTFKRSYENFLGKGVIGKRLEVLLNETDNVEKLIDFDSLGIRKQDGSPNIPITYEEWLRKEKQLEISPILGDTLACY